MSPFGLRVITRNHYPAKPQPSRLPPRNHSFLARRTWRVKEGEEEKERRRCSATSLHAPENNLFTKSAVCVRARYRGKKRKERRRQRTFIAVHRDDLSASPFLSRPAFDLNSDQRAHEYITLENGEIAKL